MRQQIHIEENVAERIEDAWDFRPADGGVRQQAYAVVSIVAPYGTNQRTPSEFGIKIYGCFPTEDKANDYAKKLQKECDVFDYYVMSTLEWVKLPPEVSSIEDMNFQENELEKLKQSTIAMRERRAKLMQQRILEDKKSAKQSHIKHEAETRFALEHLSDGHDESKERG